MKRKNDFKPTQFAFRLQSAIIIIGALLLLPVAFWLSKEFYNNLFYGKYLYDPTVENGLYLRMAFDAFELLAVSLFYLMAAFAVYGLLLRFFRKEDEDQRYTHAILRVQTLLGAALFLLLLIPFLLPGEDGGFYYLLSAFVLDVYCYPSTEAGGNAARVIAVIILALFFISWAFASVFTHLEKEKGDFSLLTPKLMESEKKNRVLGGILLGVGIFFTVLPLLCFILGAK